MPRRAAAPKDPAFVVELEEVAATRRARDAGRAGDGMAVVTDGWMNFSGARVPPPPSPEAWTMRPDLYRSELHRHAGGCLVPAVIPHERLPDLHGHRCTVTGAFRPAGQEA
jgi:hypothetical protein